MLVIVIDAHALGTNDDDECGGRVTITRTTTITITSDDYDYEHDEDDECGHRLRLRCEHGRIRHRTWEKEYLGIKSFLLDKLFVQGLDPFDHPVQPVGRGDPFAGGPAECAPSLGVAP